MILLQLVFNLGWTDESNFVDDAIDAVFCPFPDYEDGMTLPCSNINHSGSYDNDVYVLWSVGFNFFSDNQTNLWNATVPIGWFTYSSDVVSNTFYKMGQALVVLGSYLLPVADLQTLISIEVMALIVAMFVVLYIMLLIGAYKILSPVVGR